MYRCVSHGAAVSFKTFLSYLLSINTTQYYIVGYMQNSTFRQKFVNITSKCRTKYSKFWYNPIRAEGLNNVATKKKNTMF